MTIACSPLTPRLHHRLPGVSQVVRCRRHGDGRRSGVPASRRDRDGVRTDGRLGRCSVLVLHFRVDRPVSALAILAYAPFLLCLPVLLVVGPVFVVMPSGFIVVPGGVYHALVGFTDLLGLAVSRRRRAGASRVRPNISPENVARVTLVAARERGTSRTGKMARGRRELASMAAVLPRSVGRRSRSAAQKDTFALQQSRGRRSRG